MSYQDLMNIKVSTLLNAIKELHLHQDSLVQMLLPLFLKMRLFFGLMEDTFYKLRSNFTKDGQ